MRPRVNKGIELMAIAAEARVPSTNGKPNTPNPKRRFIRTIKSEIHKFLRGFSWLSFPIRSLMSFRFLFEPRQNPLNHEEHEVHEGWGSEALSS